MIRIVCLAPCFVLLLIGLAEGASAIDAPSRRPRQLASPLAAIATPLPPAPGDALAQTPRERPSVLRGPARPSLAADIEAITRRYADGLRYFNPRLTGTEAARLAGSIIGESNHYGLDARLVVAMVVTEGTVQRVRLQGHALAIAGQPAEQRIAELCDDFRRRLGQNGNTTAP